MRNPTTAEMHEMRQAWGNGRSGVALYLTSVAEEASKACIDGEGAELHRRQGEARLILELIRHFSGSSQARRVENQTAKVAVTQPI